MEDFSEALLLRGRFERGCVAGVDVIPGRLLRPIWSGHVDADHPRAA